jgi:hypothetical protein
MGPTAMRKVLGTPGASRQRKRGRARNLATRVREQSAGPAQFRDTRSVRTIVAVVALVLGAYCLIAAATALYAQPTPGLPDPEQLAARERYQWPGLIPIVFLALVAGYAIVIAARRRGRGRESPGLPSTQDPPPNERPAHRHDTTSH